MTAFTIPTDMQLTEDRLDAILGLYRSNLILRAQMSKALETCPKGYRSHEDRKSIMLSSDAKIREIEKKISFSIRIEYMNAHPIKPGEM